MDIEFTPIDVCSSDIRFRIPLYQRLFEWSTEEIRQLLNDLRSSYEKNPNEPYYIGMLTVHIRDDRWDLVDGQQRFTVMTLISIALGWSDFYQVGNELRLTFFGREEDEEFVKRQCGLSKANSNGYENLKMKAGIEYIKEYFDKITCLQEKFSFENYIKRHLTFFITTLPVKYTLADLNKYFESMNSAGRALENYEILKVELLRQIDGDKEEYTRLWNLVSNMNEPLIKLIREGNRNETYDKIRTRFKESIRQSKESSLFFFKRDKKNRLLNDIYISDEKENEEDIPCIENVEAKNEAPKPRELNFAETGLFSFPLFLLLVLYQTLPKMAESNGDNNRNVQVAEFFKVGNLLETFESNKNNFDVKVFLNNLVHYRLILDYYFIHLNEESYEMDFYGASTENNGEELSSRSPKAKLIQFQSMLYVSSTPVTYYRWLMPAFDFIDEQLKINDDVDVNKFINFLKDKDNSIHPMPSVNSLNYHDIDRYWFWRLDYYLWENSERYFENDAAAQNVADHYVFKRNRSIEHVAPQHPIGESVLQWDDANKEFLDCFGNLAMISSGQNSLLLNKPYKEKQGHVKDFIYGNRIDSIESLKMLKIYQVENWNVDEIAKHQKEMMDILEESYCG